MNHKTTKTAFQKTFQGAAINVISFGVTAIIGLILMPIIVNHLEDRLFGIWIIVGTLTGYFGFLDMGLSKAVMRFVSKSLGRNDQEQADDWISIALACFVVLAVVGCILSISIWLLAPCFISNPKDIQIIPLALLISLLAFSITLPTRCFQGVLEAHIRRDIPALVQVVIGLLRAAMVVLAIYYGGSLIALVSVSAFCSMLNGAVLVVAARHIHGSFRFRRSALQFDRFQSFLGYALSAFTSQIMDLVRYRSYPFIITPFLGLAALTPFEIAGRLTNVIIGLCNGILLNLTPAFSQFEGHGGSVGNKKLQQSYLFGYKMSCYLGTFSVGMMMILASCFVERWMGPQHLRAVPILHILLCGTFFSLIQIPTLCLLFAVSKHKFYAVSNTIHALLIVGLSLLLIVPYKLAGVAVGIMIANIVIKLFVQPYAVLALLEMGLARFHLRFTLLNVAIPMFFVVAYYYLAKGYCQPSYLNLLIVSTVAIALFIPYVFAFGFSRDERQLLLQATKLFRVFQSVNS